MKNDTGVIFTNEFRGAFLPHCFYSCLFCYFFVEIDNLLYSVNCISLTKILNLLKKNCCLLTKESDQNVDERRD